jgi:ribosomal protein L37AE/L43A
VAALKEMVMKKNYLCPTCGNTELTDLFITTPKGKSLSLHLSSQAEIRRSSGDICCLKCKQTWTVDNFKVSKQSPLLPKHR